MADHSGSRTGERERSYAEYEIGVAATCGDCGQPKVCRAFPDPDDPLDYAIEGWVCRPCANGMDAFDV